MLVRAILLPLFVQVGLTFYILFWMAGLRRTAFSSGTIQEEDIALGQQAWPVRATQVANSFGNQFELPVLFYVVVILAIVLRHADLVMVILAWLFAIFRIAHAFIHTTSNRVLVRGPIYGLGAVALLIMWVYFAVRLLLAI